VKRGHVRKARGGIRARQACRWCSPHRHLDCGSCDRAPGGATDRAAM